MRHVLPNIAAPLIVIFSINVGSVDHRDGGIRERRTARSTTLADLSPASVGRVLAPLRRGDDLLAELLDDDRD